MFLLSKQATNLKIEHLDISKMGRLTLGKRFAIGGSSDLYQGFLEQNSGRIRVAIKELRIVSYLLDEHFQKHFLREVNIWKELNHPNIVPFLGYLIEPESGPRLISPWYENGNLQQYLFLHPEANRPQLLIDVLSGMRYLESYNIAHGDLKSLNILVNEDGHACLCDFGASRILEVVTGFTTSTQNAMGTRRFLSPERLLVDRPPTIASDVWAFGCVVIEVVTRHPPYAHINSDHTVYTAIVEGKSPLNPSYDISTTPGHLFWDFISRCWIVDASRRPTIDQLLDHIRGSFPNDVHNQAVLKNTRFSWSGVRDVGSWVTRVRTNIPKSDSISSGKLPALRRNRWNF